MPVVQNVTTLDYPVSGGVFVTTLSNTSIDPDGLDLTYGGAPFYASLGEVSTSIQRSTQVVSEYLRDATDAGGGNLRSTEVVNEWLLLNKDTIYPTQLVLERLSRFAAGDTAAALGRSWMVFDEVGHLDVYFAYGTAPSSAADDLAVLNGANMALWGQELLQFRDVTSLGANLYRLTWLLRGRFGTEWAMNTHQVGENFVMMNTTTIGRVTHPQQDLDVAKFYKPVTLGQTLAQTATRGFANTGAGLMPYSPCHVSASRDGSDNLTITWYRRSRTNAEWRDGIEIPLGEDAEAYEVDILDGTGAVLRTIETSTPTASYTAANQTTDFGSPQAAIAIAIYQLSAIVGRGYATRRTV